ncbi:membrane protein [Marivirga tractuosa DSM 4126]|uniref:Membrane protein n=1 Tax=Marivirga tractuosa (strain ATCC 23168 / DSM 4126 / NBRC 15989 / NCIMB 1408 / VKM B-1430 / H-43) TaxID=643867 RepID=E4TMQ3_MARTH|nr:membrane protein [Marivirga tractuosa DSM 4126]
MLVASIVIPLVAGVLLLLSIANISHLTIPLAFWVVYTASIASLLLLWNSTLIWDSQKLIQFLHQKYPELEYSLSIFFKKDINSLEKLQQTKVFQQLPAIQKIAFPISLRSSFILLIFSGLLYTASFNYQMENPSNNQLTSTENTAEVKVDSAKGSGTKTFQYQLSVYPPSYTALKSFEWQADKKIPEGSRLVFKNQGNISFDLLWQNQYEFKLTDNQSKTFVLNQSAIFQIDYRQKDSLISLKPEILEVKRDEPPILSTNLKENRYEIEWEDLDKHFKLDLSLEDDYGIVSADIIMTLSRGEGEAVKFREMKQALRSVSNKVQRQLKTVSLPLDTFSLEPGDELYFYFSAKDNKKPKANKGKTDVYFLSIADTVESEPVEYEGFALTNEAEYFKSQRQIIIDTEKLLADKNQISQEEFEQRSNSIGADQKLLRLRYGVFLGEEYETTGGLGEVDHTGHDHGAIEGEDEHEGHGHEEHESESNFSNPIYNETPELEAYVHAHDESELSTFLDANVKAKLKAALTNMWEAELYLRTYKPREALPFEYEALKLIKEVKRASRIYVERMGFEPPPIDEEKKRLTGDLDQIDAQTTEDELQEQTFEDKLVITYKELKSAFQLEDMKKAEGEVDDFANNLVAKITTDPVRYGSLLSSVKQFQNTQSREMLRSLLIIMEDMLPLSLLDDSNVDKSMKTSLHKTYYDLLNE